MDIPVSDLESADRRLWTTPNALRITGVPLRQWLLGQFEGSSKKVRAVKICPGSRLAARRRANGGSERLSISFSTCGKVRAITGVLLFAMSTQRRLRLRPLSYTCGYGCCSLLLFFRRWTGGCRSSMLMNLSTLRQACRSRLEETPRRGEYAVWTMIKSSSLMAICRHGESEFALFLRGVLLKLPAAHSFGAPNRYLVEIPQHQETIRFQGMCKLPVSSFKGVACQVCSTEGNARLYLLSPGFNALASLLDDCGMSWKNWHRTDILTAWHG